MTPMMFVNLPVVDPARSRAFFTSLGFRFDAMFCDEGTLCMIINDATMVMLHERRRFAGYAAWPSGHRLPPGREALLAVSADSRHEVDRFADAALAGGGTHLRDADDLGFMYSRSFCDPDGHAWEIVWMDPSSIPATDD